MKRHLTGEFEKKYLRACGERARATRARDETRDAIRGETRGRCALCLWFLLFFFVFVSSGRDARGWEFSRLRGTKETRD